MSQEVMDRLLGNYDDKRKICSTVHYGEQGPKPKYRTVDANKPKTQQRQVERLIDPPPLDLRPCSAAPLSDKALSPLILTENQEFS